MILGKTPSTYEEAADLLARSHKAEQPSIRAIYLFPDPQKQEVRFIEVNPVTAPTGEAMVFSFGRAPDFPFRSAVGEVTPQEWEEIRAGRIPLPEGWDAKSAKELRVNGA
jgi:hypothetical protein